MYKIEAVSQFGEGIFYQHLTFPRYQSLLLCEQNSSIVAVGASDDQPIGLAIAKIAENQSATLQSIFVEANYRSRGIGAALLDDLEKRLVDQGCREVQVSYTTKNPTTKALEKLLSQKRWSSPESKQIICKCDRRALSAKWLQREYPLPADYQIKPWCEITRQQRLWLKDQNTRTPWIPELLNPFQHEKNHAPLNSLGLLHKEDVVGWILTHRISADTVRYTCSYVRPDLQRMARLMPLVTEAIRLQAESLPESNVIWTVPYIFPGMVQFVKKHLAPHAVYLKESKSSKKSLVGLKYQSSNDQYESAKYDARS